MRRSKVLDRTLSWAWEEQGQFPKHGDRVAIIASWGSDNQASISLENMVQRLEECGYFVMIARASDDSLPLSFSDDYKGRARVLHKPNIGYDFGSWSTALAWDPSIRSARFVILTNDSLVGPFDSLQPMIDDFEAAISPVWAATNTTQFFPHIQSFFIGFRDGALGHRPIKSFWENLLVETEKPKIIHEYELGLSRLLFSEAYSTQACFPAERVVQHGRNPTIDGWRRLVELGFPFVKRELVTNPALLVDDDLPAYIAERFGFDPRAWI